MQANDSHMSLESSYRGFNDGSGQLMQQVTEANGWCEGSPPESLSNACSTLGEIQPAFTKRVSELRAAFAHSERVWRYERYEQQSIVRAAYGQYP